jgi:hypothetical protein
MKRAFSAFIADFILRTGHIFLIGRALYDVDKGIDPSPLHGGV